MVCSAEIQHQDGAPEQNQHPEDEFHGRSVYLVTLVADRYRVAGKSRPCRLQREDCEFAVLLVLFSPDEIERENLNERKQTLQTLETHTSPLWWIYVAVLISD